MAFKVSLNGNNYISEKRKSKFEKALADGHQVKYGGNGQTAPTSEPESIVSTPAVATPPPSPPHQSPPVNGYSRLFDTLELGLKQSYGHQTETLHVHQQYLHNQAEYANIFSQLMQQQGMLFSNGNTAPEKSEITLTVLKSLAKSIEQFHQHQTETLNVHNQFLNQQSAYSQAFVQLLRQQVNGADGGREDSPNVNKAMQTAPVDVPLYRVPTQPLPVQAQVPPVAMVKETALKSVQPARTPQIPEAPAVSSQGPPAVDSAAISAMLLDIVSDKTGYPSDMLELDMDMEADLGIDSIKRVEILGALQDQAPDLPEIDAEALAELRTLTQIIEYIKQQNTETPSSERTLAAVSPQMDSVVVDVIPEKPVDSISKGMKSVLLEIVSDKTGYPAEMLELEMDMEADLGIDSIKRVEILGALQDRYPGMPEVDADTLTDLRTLQQILDYIDSQETPEKKV